jgi:S-adenosylmethionine hydrolase
MNKKYTLQVITDISDASWNEMYAVMRGIALGLSEKPLEIAPVVPVKELSILHGAFLTRLMIKSYFYPVVIFTNVAPHREYKTDLIGKIKGRDLIFMGSNNGIFDWIVRDFKLDYLAEILLKDPFVIDGELAYLPGQSLPENYQRKIASQTGHKTFSAHTVLGGVAVGLANGINYKRFGQDRDKSFVVKLDTKTGQVIHIDNYGNLKIFGSFGFRHGQEVFVSNGEGKICTGEYINDRMMSHFTHEFVIYPSTSLPGMTDVAMVRGNASARLGLEIGDVLTFSGVKN